MNYFSYKIDKLFLTHTKLVVSKMATFTQLWMWSCVLLVAPTIVVIVIVIVKIKFDSRDYCHQKGKLYPIYKKLEDALMNNFEALYT